MLSNIYRQKETPLSITVFTLHLPNQTADSMISASMFSYQILDL